MTYFDCAEHSVIWLEILVAVFHLAYLASVLVTNTASFDYTHASRRAKKGYISAVFHTLYYLLCFILYITWKHMLHCITQKAFVR